MIVTRLRVENFQSFGPVQTFKPHGRLAMLVGPNEAGKTSLLDAVAVLGRGISADQVRYGLAKATDCSVAITLQFDDNDAHVVKRLGFALDSVEITYSGDPESASMWSFRPDLPGRNFEDEDIKRVWEGAIEELGARSQHLVRNESEFRKAYESESSERSPLEDAIASAVSGLDPDGLPMTIEFSELVLSQSPFERAVAATQDVLPRVLVFDELQRDLKASYPITPPQRQQNKPVANRRPLENVLELAKLDIANLPTAPGKVDLVLRDANLILEQKFEELWGSGKPFPQLRIDSGRIHIWVLDPEHQEQSGLSVDRRSAGVLRMIEIIAFIANAGPEVNRSIILADELEQHLHYDAQVELVEWLEKSHLNAQLIASTHSLGCWPADIGSQMNALERVAGASILQNGPYSRLSAGADGLMAAIGASRVAVRVRGPVVFCEGPIDEMLLPVLFSQSGCDTSDIAFIGSLSQSKLGLPPSYPSVPSEAFIFDNDAGGKSLQERLQGADPSRVARCHPLNENGREDLVTVEDLIDPRIIAADTAVWWTNRYPNSELPALSAEEPFVAQLVKAVASMESDRKDRRSAVASAKAYIADRALDRERSGTQILRPEDSEHLRQLWDLVEIRDL